MTCLLLLLGRKQALYTGERLSVLNYPWTSITQSTLTRAMETCALIQKHLPASVPLTSSDLLTEGAPIPPDPPTKHWKPELYVSILRLVTMFLPIDLNFPNFSSFIEMELELKLLFENLSIEHRPNKKKTLTN